MTNETHATKLARAAVERTKLIPAMREVFVYDTEKDDLVYAKDIPPRCKAGAPVGTFNGNGSRQVMFNNVRYVAHEIVYAITHGTWPHRRLGFRDGNIRNINPSNLFIKE